MLRRFLVHLGAAALLQAAGCNCGSKDDAETADGGSPSGEPGGGWSGDATTVTAVEALGDEGTAVVVLRPDRWAKVHEALAPWLAKLPPEVTPLVMAREPKALPGLVAQVIAGDPSAGALAGWDLERPVVASLAEVPFDGPPGAVTAALPVADGWMPPLRHQVVVPASDVGALVASIAARLEARGKAWPAAVADREGARAVELGDVAAVVLPQRDAVRVVIFQWSSTRKPEARLGDVKERLDVKASELPRTPAASLLAHSDGVVAGWLRPWKLRALTTWQGGVSVVDALSYVSVDQRARMIGRGTQIVLSTELLMTDAGAEVDDVALSLAEDDGVLRLRAVLSLTPHGEAILEAGEKEAGDAFVPRRKDPLVDAVLRLDARAALKAATVPPAFAAIAAPSEMAEAMMEGGFLAMLYMSLRHPLGMLRTLDDFAAKQSLPVSLEVLPTAAHFVLQSLGGGSKVQMALATQWPKGHSTAALSSLAMLARGASELESLRTHDGERKGQPILVLTLGGDDPSDAFERDEKRDVDALLSARVSLSRLREELGGGGSLPGDLLMGDAQLTWERHGRALTGELAWAPRGGELEARKVPGSRRGGWSSPMGPGADDEGAVCLAKAGRSLAEGLRATSTVAGDQLAVIATKVLAEADSDLRCAVDDRDTAEAARNLRRTTVQLLAKAMVAEQQDQAAIALLDAQCDAAKDEALCAMSKARAALPRPTTPSIDWASECDNEYGFPSGDIMLRVDASGVSLDDELVPQAELTARLRSAAAAATVEQEGLEPPPEGPMAERAPRSASVMLDVDAELSMVQLRPVLQSVLDAGITQLLIPVRGTRRPKDVLRATLAAKAVAVASPPPSGTALVDPFHPDFGWTGGTVGGWSWFEIGRNMVTTRSELRPEPTARIGPSIYTLRDAMDGGWSAFLYGTDAALWTDVAATIGGVCPNATLVIASDPPVPWP